MPPCLLFSCPTYLQCPLHSAPQAGARRPQPVSPHGDAALLELITACAHLLVDSRKAKVRSHPPLHPCDMLWASVQ